MSLFNFWKKEKRKDFSCEKGFLLIVCQKLYDRFPFLYEQLKAGIIDRIMIEDNRRKIQHNVDVLNQYENKKGRYFAIERIEIFDKQGNAMLMDIHVGYGIIISYGLDSQVFDSDSISNIVTQNVMVTYFDNDNMNHVMNLLTKEELAKINPADVYELELTGHGTIYHLLDVADGDFLGIDNNKNVYVVSHDPYRVKKLDGNLVEILEGFEM